MTMTEILLEARAEGLSYGHYVAKYRPHTSFAEREDAQISNLRRYEGKEGHVVSVKCEQCGKIFPAVRCNVRFCSTTCRQRAAAARKLGREKTCAVCGRLFSTNKAYQKCCSEECSMTYRLEYMQNRQRQRSAAREPRRCVICGEPMPGAPGGQKYCSDKCRQESAERRRELRAAWN